MEKLPGKIKRKINQLHESCAIKVKNHGKWMSRDTLKRKSLIIAWLTRANMRMAFLSLIGLVVAISMLASCQYYNEYITKEHYLDIFGDTGIQQFELEFEIVDCNSFNPAIDSYIVQHGLEDVLSIAPLYPAAHFIQQNVNYDVSFDNLTDPTFLSGYMGIDDSLLVDCVNNSRLPSNYTEILVITPDNTSLRVNDVVTMGIGYRYSGNVTTYNLNLTVAGIMTDSSIPAGSPLKYLQYANNYHFFTQLDFFIDIITESDQLLASSSISTKIILKFDINTAAINLFNAKEIAKKVTLFLGDIRDKGSRQNIFSSNIRSLEGMMKETGYAIILQLSFPVIILVIALAMFSTSIFNAKREKTLIFLKTRGVRGRFLFISLLAETLVIAIIAGTLSVVLGILLAVIAGLPEGTLSSTNNIPNFMAMLDIQLFISIIIQGVILTFLISIPAIIKLSRAKIIALEKITIRKRLRKLRVLSGYLDIILLVMGLAGLFLVFYISFILFNTPGLFDIYVLLMPFIVLLLVTSPFLFLTGAVMFYNRFILIIINLTGKGFWKRDAWILASAARNLRVNVKITVRTAIIICICLSFPMLLSIAPITIIKNSTDSSYYNTGSDISVSVRSNNGMRNELIIQNISAALADVPGLETTKVIECKLRNPYGGKDYDLFGIESGFENIAHWKSNYDDTPLEELCSVLFNSEVNNTVILDSATAKEENIDINDSYQLFSGDQHTTVPLEFTDYFPVVGSLSRYKGIKVIGKYSYVNNISNQGEFNERRSVLGKIFPGHDPSEVSDQAKDALKEHGIDFGEDNYLHIQWYVPENGTYYSYTLRYSFAQDGMLENSESIIVTVFWGVLTNDFVISLVVILAAIVLFNYTRLQQNTRELGLNRSLGMKYHQIFALMFSEPMILLAISGIPGGILGSITFLGIIQILGLSQFTGPPIVLYYDLPLIIATYAVLLVFIALFVMIISFKATKVNISDYLKLE